MRDKVIIPYKQACQYIEDADVLLFRANESVGSPGWWITRYTGGIHSHVALAYHMNNEIFCVEQREFKGGRSVILSSQVAQFPNMIDVYRAAPSVWNIGDDFVWTQRQFDKDIKCNIIDTSLSLTGQPYGWRNIWGIFKCYAPGLRLIYRPKNGDDTISKAYVCSTVVTYSYRINYFDPCPNLKDESTKPSDIAQSALFNYLFTIGPINI